MNRTARVVLLLGALLLSGGMDAAEERRGPLETARINAAEAEAARYRAELANPPGRYNGKFDALYAITSSDVAAAFMTEADLAHFKKQEAWLAEHNRRLDFELSPAGRAQARANEEAERARKARAGEAALANAIAKDKQQHELNTAALRLRATALIQRAEAGDAKALTLDEAMEMGALAEAIITNAFYHGRPASALGVESSWAEREALGLKLYGLAGGVSGRERGAMNPDFPTVRRAVPIMDLAMAAALVKGGHGDIVLRQTRALRALAGSDPRIPMQITVGLAAALAMPNSDFTPGQRRLAAGLLAARLWHIPPSTGKLEDLDGPALSWMLLAAAKKTPELARAASLNAHFLAQATWGVWHTDFKRPAPSDAAAAYPVTAQGDWWNLAGMLVLAEKSRYPGAWFAAIRTERRAKRHDAAPAGAKEAVQAALDDWFARNGAPPAVREVIQADCTLACDGTVEALAKSAAWDAFVLSAGSYVSQTAAVEGRMEALLASTLLKKALEVGRDDPTGVQRWLVDPIWQPGAKASLATWRAWLDLAGLAGVVVLAERTPEKLQDPVLLRRAIDSLHPDADGQLSPSSEVVAHALIPHTAAITEPSLVKDIALIRGRSFGDWAELAPWLEDPRRRPKADSDWYDLYEAAIEERNQVAGKLEGYKGGPNADFALCGRIEAWLKAMLAAEGAARAKLLADSPDDCLTKPDLKMLGYDVARGGFASRAMLLLATPEFDPRRPVQRGGSYDPNPWLAAVAKLPTAVDAEELVTLLETTVRRAARERSAGGKAIDSRFTLAAGEAAQRALGRLGKRWSPARVPAQAAILRLHDAVLVEGHAQPNPNAVLANVTWERAKMRGLNTADAFALADALLRREDLEYIVALGANASSLAPLVISADAHFFREARRALSKRSPDATGTPFHRSLANQAGSDDELRLNPAVRAAVYATLAQGNDVTDPETVLLIARIRGPKLGDWAKLGAWLDDPRRQPPGKTSPLVPLYERAVLERDQAMGNLRGRPWESTSSNQIAAERFQQWLYDALNPKKTEPQLTSSEAVLRIIGAENYPHTPNLNILGYDTPHDAETSFLALRALLLLTTDDYIPGSNMKGGRYDAGPWLKAVDDLPGTMAVEFIVKDLADRIRATHRPLPANAPTTLSHTARYRQEVGLACQRALGRLASRWNPAREAAQAALLELGGDLLADGDSKPNLACIAARITWESCKMRGLDDADAISTASTGLSPQTLRELADSASVSGSQTPLLLEADPTFARELQALLAAKG